jgi:hypothetical protein
MKLSEFDRLLDIYGPDLLAWPEKQKSSAARLIASSWQAQRRFEAAQLFADVLERALVFPEDEGVAASRLVARVVNRIDVIERTRLPPHVTIPRPERTTWPFWVKTGTGSFMAAVIFLLGMGFGSARDAGADSAAIQSLIVNGSYGSNAVL